MRRMPMMLIVVAGYVFLRNWNGDVVPLAVIGGVVAAVGLVYRAYQRRVRGQRTERVERENLDELIEQVEEKLAGAANRILDLENRPALGLSDAASEHFQRGVAAFVSADRMFDEYTSTYQLQSLVAEIDDAIWRLEAAKAVLNGEETPAKPGVERSARDASRSTTITDVSAAAVSRWVGGEPRGRSHRRSC